MENKDERTKATTSIPSIENLKISGFTHLSLLEIMTLQILLRYPGPIIRHTLYLEVNQFIQQQITVKNDVTNLNTKIPMEENLQSVKKLSTSSFYNSLSVLESKGFIAFNRNEKGKIETVESTLSTKLAINTINNYFLLTMIDDSEFCLHFVQKLIEKTIHGHINSLLTVLLHEYIDLRLLEFLSRNVDEHFVLTKNPGSIFFLQLNIDNINYSSIRDRLIREPNDIFDAVVIPYYCPNINFSGLTSTDLLKEINRVTKPSGRVYIIVRKDLPITNNYLANELIKFYNEAISIRGLFCTKQQLRADMTNSGFSKIEFTEDQGLVIGIGYV